MKRLKTIGACCLLAGCTTANYSPSTGIKYKNFFFQKQFSELSINTNGTVTLKGYQSEANQLIEATARGVATGLGKAVVP